MNYFVFIRRNYHCFTGNVKFDVASANKNINNTLIIIQLMDMFQHLNELSITFME